MGVDSAKVIVLETAFQPQRISDEEHLRRALLSGAPHSYLVENAHSIGAYNVEDLHMALIGAQLWKRQDMRFFKNYLMIPELDSYQPTQVDVQACVDDMFFKAAFKRMNKHYKIPVMYTAILGRERQQDILTSDRRTFFIFD